MKSEPSTAARTFRAAALAITLVTLVMFGAVAYSAYSIFSGVENVGKSGSHAVQVESMTQGSSATLLVNATVANSGLLPLRLSAACTSVQPGITCSQGSVTISPHQEGTLRFQVNIANVTRIAGGLSGVHVNGTITAELVPFASLSVTVDLGSLLSGGGK